MVLAGRAKATPKLADGVVEAIRLVKIGRDSAVRAHTQAMITLKATLVTASDDLRGQLEPLSDFKLINGCAALDTTGDIADPAVAMRHTLASLARRWLELHEEIKTHSRHLKRLTHTAAPDLVAAFGVVPDTAAEMLVTAGDNTDRIGSDAALAKLCGGPGAVVVDAHTGNEVFRLTGHRGGVLDVAWSPDGTSIATAGVDGSARVYDASTGEQRFALLGHRYRVVDLDWAPASGALVTASWDGTAKFWIFFEGAAREWATLSARNTRNGVQGVAFSPDGSRVMTGNWYNTATTVWDVGPADGAEVGSLVTTAFDFARTTYTPDGRHILASGPAGSVAVWDASRLTYVRSLGAAAAPGVPSWVSSGRPPVATPADVTHLDVSRDGRLVAASTVTGVRVWDIESGDEIFAVPASVPGAWPHVRWSPTEDVLAVTSYDREAIGTPQEVAAGGLVTIFDRSGRTVQGAPGGGRLQYGVGRLQPRRGAPVHLALGSGRPAGRRIGRPCGGLGLAGGTGHADVREGCRVRARRPQPHGYPARHAHPD